MAPMRGRETRPTNGQEPEELSPLCPPHAAYGSRAAPVHVVLRAVRLLPSQVDRLPALLGRGAEHRSDLVAPGTVAHRVEHLRLLPQRVDRRPSLETFSLPVFVTIGLRLPHLHYRHHSLELRTVVGLELRRGHHHGLLGLALRHIPEGACRSRRSAREAVKRPSPLVFPFTRPPRGKKPRRRSPPCLWWRSRNRSPARAILLALAPDWIARVPTGQHALHLMRT